MEFQQVTAGYNGWPWSQSSWQTLRELAKSKNSM